MYIFVRILPVLTAEIIVDFCPFLKIFSSKLFEKVTNKIKYYTRKTPGKIEKTLDFKPKLLIFYKKFRNEHTIYGIAKFCHTQLYKLKIENGKWKIVNPVDKFI